MGQHDRGVRMFEVSAGEAFGAELAEAACAAVLEALRAGGYPRPTDEQFARIARDVTRDALAAGVALHAAGVRVPDEALDEAAALTAHEAVRAVLGPPPQVQ